MAWTRQGDTNGCDLLHPQCWPPQVFDTCWMKEGWMSESANEWIALMTLSSEQHREVGITFPLSKWISRSYWDQTKRTVGAEGLGLMPGHLSLSQTTCVLNHLGHVWLLRPYELEPARLLCPWDSPGRTTGVSSHGPLQGIFPTQESNLCLLCLLHCWRILTTEPPGKPQIKLHWLQFRDSRAHGFTDDYQGVRRREKAGWKGIGQEAETPPLWVRLTL